MIEIKIAEKMRFENIDDLVPGQGELKELTKENYEKLKNEILKNGFIAPFFIWRNEQHVYELLDGHQRQLTLKQMRDHEGIEIPDLFPCVEIYAESREEASRILLALTSQYGTMTTEGLYKYAQENNISIDEMITRFHMEYFPMQKFREEFFDRNARDHHDDYDEDAAPSKPKENKLCPHCGMAL